MSYRPVSVHVDVRANCTRSGMAPIGAFEWSVYPFTFAALSCSFCMYGNPPNSALTVLLATWAAGDMPPQASFPLFPYALMNSSSTREPLDFHGKRMCVVRMSGGATLEDQPMFLVHEQHVGLCAHGICAYR